MNNTICQQSIKPWNYQLWHQSIPIFSPLLYILIFVVIAPPLQSVSPQEPICTLNRPLIDILNRNAFEYPLLVLHLNKSVAQTSSLSKNALQKLETVCIFTTKWDFLKANGIIVGRDYLIMQMLSYWSVETVYWCHVYNDVSMMTNVTCLLLITA